MVLEGSGNGINRKRRTNRAYIAEQLEPRVLLTGVTITNATLDYNHVPNAFKFDLSAALPTPLTANQFLLDDLTTDTLIPASKLTVTTSTDGLHVTVGVHNLVDANNVALSTCGRTDVLPNGWFRLSLSHLDVPQLAADWSFQDYYLIADTAGETVTDTAGRDGVINLSDINRTDHGYQNQGSGGTIDFNNGDFNYDGVINSSDYALLDQAYDTGLINPTQPLPPTTITVLRAPAGPDINIGWNADAVTGELGWRVEESTDGQNFDTYWNVNDTAHLTGSSVTWTVPDLSGIPQAHFVYYRIRAYGNGQDTAYSAKGRTATYLPQPSWDPVSTSTTTGDSITIQFEDNSTNEAGFTMNVNDDDDVFVDHSFIATLPAQDGTGTYSYTIPGLTPNANYSFYISAISPLGGTRLGVPSDGSINSGAQMPEGDWTFEVGPSNPEYGQVSTDEWDDDNAPDERTATMTVSDLPRHIDSNVTVDVTPFYSNDPALADATVTLKINGEAKASWQTNDAPNAANGDWTYGANYDYGTADPDGVFEDQGNTITVELVGEGFPTTAGYHNDWRVDYVSVQTYFPKVSLTGGGTAIEDGSGDGYLTVDRGGDATVWKDPLTVNLKPDGGTAKAGKDYTPVTSITIPAGQGQKTVKIDAINDDAAEGLLDLYESISSNSQYALAFQNTPGQVGPTTAKAQKNDEVRVSKITRNVDRNNFSFNWASGYEFYVDFLVEGEGLDRASLRQNFTASTDELDWNGSAESEVQMDYESSGDPNFINSDGSVKDWDWLPLKVEPASHGGRAHLSGATSTVNGLAVGEDNHVFRVPSGGDNDHIGKISWHSWTGDDFILNGDTGEQLPDTYEWSYSWTNSNCATSTSDYPACAIDGLDGPHPQLAGQGGIDGLGGVH